MSIIQELKKGNVSVLEKLNECDKEYTFELIGNSKEKDEILRRILPIMRNTDNWYEMELEIFEMIYLNKEYQEYTFYLLHKEYVKPENLIDKLEQILKNTSWGLDYILHNFEGILKGPNYQSYCAVIQIIDYLGDKKDIEQIFFEKIMSLLNSETREWLIIRLIYVKSRFNTKNIIKSLYKNLDEFDYKQGCLPFFLEEPELISSTLPKSLLSYTEEYPELGKMIIENFKIFFQVEEKSKMALMNHFIDSLPKEILKQYQELFRLYQCYPTFDIDNLISVVIDNQQDSFINSFIKQKEAEYLGRGTITHVFRIGNQVLKFSFTKYVMDTERDLFLIAPTETKIVYNKNGAVVLIIEIQEYLSRDYHNQPMKTEDVDNFLEELDRQGYEIRDPLCLEKKFDNFGFLNDYHDANLTGFTSAEDLPEWFKERPIVLYDIDLVYKKDYENKKFF